MLIVDRHTNRIVEADLIEDISPEEAASAAALWLPYRERLAGELPMTGSFTEDWDWARKRHEAKRGTHKIAAIAYNGRIEGLIMYRIRPTRSRRPNSGSSRILYVEYLESAPWNQPKYVADRAEFASVGIALLTHVIHESERLDCGGQVGLLSLPEAENYYKRWFVDLGLDRKEKLRYFELTEDRALKFLRGKRADETA